MRGETAVGGGWVARARRLLETQPDDIVERGYLLTHEFFQHLGRGDFARAGETAAGMVETGRRFSDPDLVAQGLMCQGRIMIYSGRVPGRAWRCSMRRWSGSRLERSRPSSPEWSTAP